MTGGAPLFLSRLPPPPRGASARPLFGAGSSSSFCRLVDPADRRHLEVAAEEDPSVSTSMSSSNSIIKIELSSSQSFVPGGLPLVAGAPSPSSSPACGSSISSSASCGSPPVSAAGSGRSSSNIGPSGPSSISCTGNNCASRSDRHQQRRETLPRYSKGKRRTSARVPGAPVSLSRRAPRYTASRPGAPLGRV